MTESLKSSLRELAKPWRCCRRGRRAINYADPEPDDDEEDLELGPADDDDGWD